MKSDSPIATSWSVRWREWRIRALPALTFAGSVAVIAFLWRTQLVANGPFADQASVFGQGENVEWAGGGALPRLSMNQPTPAPLPGGELTTSTRLEAPLLGGAGGGFMVPMRGMKPWRLSTNQGGVRLRRAVTFLSATNSGLDGVWPHREWVQNPEVPVHPAEAGRASPRLVPTWFSVPTPIRNSTPSPNL